ncbi:hypothetical protein LCGC14_1319080 [marine sediment metagenome]|uniref:Uncharacterized protein n=1 Tax=marine sediment metagenome TaxID=412755 RepID=A0A0F9NMA5_9ZZZZ
MERVRLSIKQRRTTKVVEMKIEDFLTETNWSYDDAKIFIKQISDIAHQSGFDIELIGSVKSRGKSQNDLDLLLIPIHRNHDIEMLMLGFDNMRFSQDQVRNDLLMLELPDGRHVDLFIQDYLY